MIRRFILVYIKTNSSIVIFHATQFSHTIHVYSFIHFYKSHKMNDYYLVTDHITQITMGN